MEDENDRFQILENKNSNSYQIIDTLCGSGDIKELVAEVYDEEYAHVICFLLNIYDEDEDS